mgnify:CR=1 FL=1
MTKITIGARGSKLSLAYVSKVKELLIKNNKDLKEENINLTKMLNDIENNGYKIKDFITEQSSLEEIFIKLIKVTVSC